MVGDSITKGQYVAPAFSWPVLVDQWLRTEGIELHLYTSAVSGETTTRGIDRLIIELHSFVPSFVFIQFGLNDANYWRTEGGRTPRTSLNRFRENLAEMVFRARDAGVEEVTLFTNHRVFKSTTFESCSYLESKDIYDQAIRDVAGETRANLLDLAHLTEPVFSEDHVLPSPDSLHLSPVGHEAYSGIVIDHLETVVIPRLRGAVGGASSEFNYRFNAEWT